MMSKATLTSILMRCMDGGVKIVLDNYEITLSKDDRSISENLLHTNGEDELMKLVDYVLRVI